MTSKQYLKSLGAKIKSIREEKGVTQKQLAKKTGMKQTNISAIELGQNVSVKILMRIASALDCELQINFKEK